MSTPSQGPAPALPMFGSRRARVLEAQPVSLHGDIYHDLLVILSGEPIPLAPPTGRAAASEQPVRLRVPSHLCRRPPEAGDILELTFLMQQVNGVRFY